MKPVTTVFELSKILKLSPSTVSRALKNHPDIAPETRKKVLELAQKLDYEPNLYAVGLRTRRTKEFAVIVPNLSGFFYDSLFYCPVTIQPWRLPILRYASNEK